MNDTDEKILSERVEICKDLAVSAVLRSDVIIIRIEGTMGLSELGQFQKHLETLFGNGRYFALDLSALKYVNSACIALFVQLYKRFEPAGKKAVILSPSGYVLKVLTLVGLDRLLPICQNWEEASARLKAIGRVQGVKDSGPA